MRFIVCMLLLSFYCFVCMAQTPSARHRAVAPGPMSCKIEGKIIRILPPSAGDGNSICAKYPCRAKVKIIEVFGCGSSVSAALNQGDTLTMRFPNTLHPTAKIFPKMKVQYPGLKKGSEFIAIAEQRLIPGATAGYTIFDYELK
jgi:hypothetical protein